MKFFSTALIAFVASTVSSQGLPQVPGCALQCLSILQADAQKTGCGALSLQNAKCFCSKRSSFSSSISCVHRVCNSNDANAAVNAFLNHC